jgi:flagellar hook-basal body complex protein FliE
VPFKPASRRTRRPRKGLNGQGDLTQIVTSVTQAQLALQTTVALRDRMVEAYQSIMNMPI